MNYKEMILINIDREMKNYGTRYTATELNLIHRFIRNLRLRNYDILIDDIIDLKICNLLENKLDMYKRGLVNINDK